MKEYIKKLEERLAETKKEYSSAIRDDVHFAVALRFLAMNLEMIINDLKEIVKEDK